ncbi:MAG: TSUP family transporter [Sandaracinus sp.]|nr:TSUP family transporter [Sandaracinus sp.]
MARRRPLAAPRADGVDRLGGRAPGRRLRSHLAPRRRDAARLVRGGRHQRRRRRHRVPGDDLALRDPPAIARDFGLMIQTVGMGAAAAVILVRGRRSRLRRFVSRPPRRARSRLRPALRRALRLGPGGEALLLRALGRVRVGAPPREQTWRRAVEADVLSRPSSQVWLVVAGLIGGVVSSLVGTGLDIVVFAVLVLRLGVSETVATPTSVVLMAIGSALGFALRASSGGPHPEAWAYWWTCVPVVVVGAPLGARFIEGKGVASCRACSTRRWWRRRSARSSCCRSRRACSPSRRPPSCSASSSSSASRVRARGWPRCLAVTRAERLFRSLLEARRGVLVGVALVCGVAAFFAAKVRPNYDAEAFLPTWDARRQVFEDHRRSFEDDDRQVLVFVAGTMGPATHAHLRRVADLRRRGPRGRSLDRQRRARGGGPRRPVHASRRGPVRDARSRGLRSAA